jgi:2-enoate reductase
MARRFPYLFQPGKIGKVELKNRLVMAPMGIGALTDFNGTFSERAIDYYEARAKGGIGLIVTTVCLTTNRYEPWEIDGLSYLPTLDNPVKIKNLKQLTERVHDHGCKIFAQLTAGWGRVYRPSMIEQTKHKPFAPSPTPLFWAPHLIAREMTSEEIEGLIESMGKAAFLAKAGGFDGLELHGHEGYLLDQFKTILWNRRTDNYGGDLNGRMRFPLAIIKRINEIAGEDFPIVYRYGLEHKIDGGRTIEEGVHIAEILEKAGVAALHVDAGCYENWYWPHPPEYQPPGCMVEMAEQVKHYVKIPIIAVGRLGYPKLANEVIKEGKADFIALGRALLADPDFAKKVMLGETEDIRPCIGCHECFRRLYESTYISCAVNPSCGNEKRLEIRKTKNPKKIMVIGGGIAGIQAALVCEMRGHQVTLYEKTEHLGGLLYSVGLHSLKKDLKDLLDYQIRQIRKRKIEIKMGIEVNFEIVKDENPDVIFLATGSIPLLYTDIKGVETTQTFSTIDVLEKRGNFGANVVIIGGGSAGCEIAYELADGKRKITVCEQFSELAADLFKANKDMLMELLKFRDINILLNCKVVEIAPGIVRYKFPNGTEGDLEVDSIVLAIGRQSVNGLLPQISELIKEIHVIGDCVAPRKVKDAMWEAYKKAIKI